MPSLNLISQYLFEFTALKRIDFFPAISSGLNSIVIIGLLSSCPSDNFKGKSSVVLESISILNSSSFFLVNSARGDRRFMSGDIYQYLAKMYGQNLK